MHPEKASRYALDHYAEHLKAVADSAAAEDYLAMTEDGGRRAKEHRDRGPGTFAADVRAAWDALRTRHGKAAHLGAQWRCALVLSSIHSIGLNVPGLLLVQLVKDGSLSPEQARRYAEMKGPAEDTVTALARIAVHLINRPRLAAEFAHASLALAGHHPGLTAKALQELVIPPEEVQGPRRLLLDAAQLADALAAITSENKRVETLASLVPHLDSDLRAAAFAAAKIIGSDAQRSTALVELAPHLDAGQRIEALIATKSIGDEASRSNALRALTRYLDNQQRAAALGLPSGSEERSSFATATSWR